MCIHVKTLSLVIPLPILLLKNNVVLVTSVFNYLLFRGKNLDSNEIDQYPMLYEYNIVNNCLLVNNLYISASGLDGT